MDPVTELICNSDELFSDHGKLEFLLNYDKVLDVEIQSLNTEMQAELENLTTLQNELHHQEEFLSELIAI